MLTVFSGLADSITFVDALQEGINVQRGICIAIIMGIVLFAMSEVMTKKY